MFADNVRMLLKERDKRQKDLAEFVGVKENTVSDWLNKGSSPSLDHLCRISEFLGASLDFLILGKECVHNSASNISNSNVIQGHNAGTLIVHNGGNERRELSGQEMELLRIYNQLDIKRQTSLLSFAYELEDDAK